MEYKLHFLTYGFKFHPSTEKFTFVYLIKTQSAEVASLFASFELIAVLHITRFLIAAIYLLAYFFEYG